jgi:hypothetical protein
MISPKPTADIFKTVGNRKNMYDKTDFQSIFLPFQLYNITDVLLEYVGWMY